MGLIGSACSDETVGGIATLTNAGLTTISPSNTRPALTAPDRGAEFAGYLRTAHSDAFQGKAVAEFVFNELGMTKAATIHDGSAYGQALQQVFADEFTALGGTITVQEAVQKGQTDMKPVLTAVAATDPEVIYFPIFTAEGGSIAAQSREVAGLEDIVLIGSDGMFSADFVKAAGPAALNMYLSSPNFSAFQAGYSRPARPSTRTSSASTRRRRSTPTAMTPPTSCSRPSRRSRWRARTARSTCPWARCATRSSPPRTSRASPAS